MLRFPAVLFQKLDWAHILAGRGSTHLDHTLIPSQANLGQADVQILFSFRTTIRGLVRTVEYQYANTSLERATPLYSPSHPAFGVSNLIRADSSVMISTSEHPSLCAFSLGVCRRAAFLVLLHRRRPSFCIAAAPWFDSSGVVAASPRAPFPSFLTQWRIDMLARAHFVGDV